MRPELNPRTVALAKEPRASCYLCKAVDLEPDGQGDAVELRPYGPGGKMICFNCMTSSPEREAEAKRQFGAQLDACGDVAIIGETTGPRPFDGGKDG